MAEPERSSGCDATCEHESINHYYERDRRQLAALKLCDDHARERDVAFSLLDKRAEREAAAVTTHNRQCGTVRIPRLVSRLEARMAIEALYTDVGGEG